MDFEKTWYIFTTYSVCVYVIIPALKSTKIRCEITVNLLFRVVGEMWEIVYLADCWMVVVGGGGRMRPFFCSGHSFALVSLPLRTFSETRKTRKNPNKQTKRKKSTFISRSDRKNDKTISFCRQYLHYILQNIAVI